MKFLKKHKRKIVLSTFGIIIFCFVLYGYILDTSSTGKRELNEMDSAQLHSIAQHGGEDVEKIVAAPIFSRGSGFYKKSFKLRMEVPEGISIYYTTDGSLPSIESQKYEHGILISDASLQENTNSMRSDFCPYQMKPYYKGQQAVMPGYYQRYLLPEGNLDKCTVIRAIAVDEEGNTSDVATASYFIDYQNKTGYSNIAVLSIVTDPDGLFSDDNGILVNGSRYKENLANGTFAGSDLLNEVRDYTNQYALRGKDSERASHIDFFDESGNQLVFSQEVGLRLHGNQSRVAYPHKSFNLYARKRYDGNNTFLDSLFGDGTLDNEVTLMRGNDIRNYYLSQLMDNRTMDAQDYRMVQVFLDGEYWGLYAIQERYASTGYMKKHYNLDEDDYSLLVGGTEGFDSKNGNEEINHSSFRMLRYYLEEHDASDPKIYKTICSMMDIQSFIDVYACKLYIADQDWSWFKNQCISYYDNQWHWMCYDMDYTAGEFPRTVFDFDTFSSVRLAKSQSLYNDKYFRNLKKNKEFRDQFINTLLDLGNETFSPEKIKADCDYFLDTYWDATMKDMGRFPIKGESVAYDMENHTSYYRRNFDEMLDFFERRFPCAVEFMEEFFYLEDELVNLDLKVSEVAGGRIHLNTISPTLNEEGGWTGQYLTGHPLTVTAEPAEGYEFAGWECSGGVIADDASISTKINLKGNTTLTAIFQKKAN